jgi:ribosomal protein L18
MTTKVERRTKIKYRVRSKISGTSDCPRMSVFRSNKQIYVQIIDDLSGKTLTSVTFIASLSRCHSCCKPWSHTMVRYSSRRRRKKLKT